MQLVVIAGPDKGRAFPLPSGTVFVIGRGKDSHTKLVDEAASRTHCEVVLKNGRAILSDAKSASGTFVNDRRITSRELKHGDVIKVGDTTLRFESDVTERKTILPALGKPTIIFANKPGTKKLPKHIKELRGLVGKSLGGFQLRRVVGDGQIGVVFEARDSKDGKTVALKVLRADFAQDDKAKQRFKRGVKAARKLSHPNLVEIYNAGIAEPYHWISMELLECDSLSKILQEKVDSPERDWKLGLRYAIHIARALQTVHEHDIVHRSVTPPNILVRKADRTAKLGDVSFAKPLGAAAADDLTSTGEYVGNFYYMAPERTQQAAKVDGRADLFGLGATLYHFHTGRLPFDGESMAEVLTKIREAAPEKISCFNSKVPEVFEKVVTRLLAKKPEERYLSARVLLRELESIAKANRVEV